MILTEGMGMEARGVEIGPISGIHPVAMVRPGERFADLGKVFAAELRHQGGGAEDSPNEKAKRGLEEEDVEDGAGGEEDVMKAGGVSDRTVNFFA